MLGAFFGEGYRDWWLYMLLYPNHWLVRKSAARAFSNGLYEVNQVCIGPGRPIDVQGRYTLLGDHSRTGIEKVDPRFVGTHAGLCQSVQYIELADEIASEILPESSSLLALLPTRIFLSIWLLFPNKLRIAAYDVLIKVGKRMYGMPDGASAIYRLSFGLYLRYPGRLATCRNEFNALQLAVNPDMAKCNTLGEACSDPRLRGWDPMGPFRDEAAFSAIMRLGNPARRGHKTVLTHADLNPRNILVDRVDLPDGSHGWQVTGIVDWETAGYHSEYWDYTKALYEGFRWRRRELHVERESWAMADGI
ncbi:hypothetical protein BD414DRAFT_522103 [Trametes punicea]|nr:hypothetical protein BD414DRAFT_522103 [Trametes punicea]